MVKRTGALVSLSMVFATLPRAAAEAAPILSEPRPSAQAVRRSGPIAVDGRLDEPAWQAATASGAFWQRDPDEGAAPKAATEFRVLYDDAALYVGVRAFAAKPGLVRGLLTRRDEGSPSDWIWVSLDSYLDRRTAFRFGLNPVGVERDALIYDDVEFDFSWDAVWQGGAARDEHGWTAEFRIPLSQLRFSGASDQTWGLQVERTVQHSREDTFWVPWPRESTRRVGLFGDLKGIRGIKQGVRLELLPFTLLGADLQPSSSSRGSGALFNFGLDAKYGITSNFTLDATINPDFGQVEADPSQVNLTAQETFFAEKRPFFLEGADIFRYGIGGESETLFYSRRIGAPPTGSPNGYEILDGPSSTTIFGAVKLSGKTASGWSIGALTALTGKETALVDDTAGGTLDETVEPLANYSVLRAQKDLDGGRAKLGLVLTATHRDLGGTGFASLLHDRAYTGGLQYSHRFGENKYFANAKLYGSSVHGSAEAIDVTQRASPRYFQRPDAPHLGYDATRTRLHGFGFQYDIGYTSGKNWRGTIGGNTKSPGFEANDLGFQRLANEGVQWFWLQRRDDTPGQFFRTWNINFNVWEVFDYQPKHLGAGGNLAFNAVFPNYWSTNVGINPQLSRWNNGALRGGPALRSDFSYSAWANVNSDSRRAVWGNVSANLWQQPASGSANYNLSLNLNFQILSNLNATLGTFYSRRDDNTQYVGEFLDAGAVPHYLLASIAQNTTGLTLRVNYTMTPKLSLQIYAQPFVASGHYRDFKEADNARAAAYDDRFHVYSGSEIAESGGVLTVDRDVDGMADFTFDRPDFNFRQLRSTVVLRWEYLQGSTLFFVWSHGRQSDAFNGDLALGRDLSGLFSASGEHVLLAKLTYWFST